jgi:predicted permease
MALLGLASLLAVSLGNVAREELGIKPTGLVTFGLTPYLNGYDGAQAQALVERVQRELEAVPTVSSTAASTMPVMSGGRARNYVVVEGFVPGADTDMRTNFARTAPEYFRTLGIPLLAGREFASTDVAGSPAVAVVNETFTRLFRLGPNPIGKRIGLGRGETAVFDITIVGLVADAKYSQIAEPPGPQLFLPLRQAAFGPVAIYVRSESDPRAVMGTIPDILRRIDPALPVERLRTMEEQVRENAAPRRALAWVSSGFAGIATLLAAVGLYGLLSYAVTQRLREIGIRVALGATRVAIWRLIFSHLGWMLTVGAIAGSALAIALGRLGRSMLFGVDAYDAGAVARALAVILLVGLAAGAIPARRAARVNPARALRFD